MTSKGKFTRTELSEKQPAFNEDGYTPRKPT